MNYHYYYTREEHSQAAIRNLIDQIGNKKSCLHLAFFAGPQNNQEYNILLQEISNACKKTDFPNTPLISLVSQPQLDNNTMALEVQSLEEKHLQTTFKEHYKTPYVKIEGKEHTALIIGGLRGEGNSIREQSDSIFALIHEIFLLENFNINQIVRQWNYIEQITAVNHGVQNYQAFNDSRSIFYRQTDWNQSGYPAATGIGMISGGVVVDLIACKPNASSCLIAPIDNPLQIAAHAYSEEMLLGEKDLRLQHKSTPKFERAKLIQSTEETICFISGTAAIRGEKSALENSIESQTEMTIENIEYLISEENLQKEGINPPPALRLKSLRVYIKKADDYFKAKKILEMKFPHIPVLYVWSDVCRDELLIEIEGIATTK